MSPCTLVLSAFLGLTALFTVSACSSSSTTSSTGSCTDTFNALCEQACGCGESGSCTLIEVTDAGLGASISFQSLNDCESLYSLACGTPGGVRANFDYSACAAAAQSAACVSDSSGTKGNAYPSVCNPNAIDGGA